ncbi:MAG: hypothetical protein AB2A00_01800 [Myxococcota bacterium]
MGKPGGAEAAISSALIDRTVSCGAGPRPRLDARRGHMTSSPRQKRERSSPSPRRRSAQAHQASLPGMGHEPGLIHVGSERLATLKREHDRLLAGIKKAQEQHKELLDQAQAFAAKLQARMGPLMEEAQRLCREIHGMFRELLQSPRHSKRARRDIQEIYDSLQIAGGLPPQEVMDLGGAGFPPRPGEHPAPGAEAPPPSRETAEGAVRPERHVLRSLFRRLAEALHPDKVHHDEDTRQERTEMMKEVTAAYHEGDLARLLRVEASLAKGDIPSAPPSADEEERRCEALERMNAELRRQLRGLQKELRHLRHAPELGLARDFAGDEGIDALLNEATEELDDLRLIRDFVKEFRDGRITLAQFRAGPGHADDDMGEPPDMQDVFDELVDSMFSGLRPSSGGRRGGAAKGRKKKRAR